jgi:DNA polymerase elongation subunit (family B)
MFDPLADQFHPVLSKRETFSREDASTLLYGMDETERVLAIEPGGQNEVILYKLGRGRRTETERRVSQPWAIVAEPAPFTNRADATIRELRGSHRYRYLVTFASWDAYRFAIPSDMRRNAGIIGPPTQVGQYQVRAGTTLFKGMEYRDLRRMQIDLETRTLDPSDPDAGILMISLKQHASNFEDVLILESTEGELIERLNRTVRNLDPDVIEGHNIFGFDIPYLVHRARIAGVPLRLGRDGSAPWIQEDNRRQTVAYIHGRHVIDTYTQIQRFDVQGNLTRYGLKEVIRQMGLEREDRVFVDRTRITEMWDRGERSRDQLADYALDDVRDVDVLSRVIMPNEFYQTQMLPLSFQRSALTGTGRKIDELMLRSYLAAGHSLPQAERARPYPGGYVELVHAGVFGPVVKSDVESLYPSIMIRESIASDRDVLEAFPLLLSDLTQRRLHAKQQARETESETRATWHGLQGGLKILINSFYGYLGFARGSFNDYAAAERVTLEGQRIIQHTVELLNERGAEPIEVDTDGVYFSPPSNVTTEDEEERFIEDISDSLPEGIRLAHDGRFRHMLALKQKTYALIDHKGNLTVTGSALRSRALEPCFREFITDAARAFMESSPEAVRDLYFDLAIAIRNRELSIHDISQWTMLNQERMGSRIRLKALIDANPGRWRYGERLEIYEKEGGVLGLSEDYDKDENVTVLLKRLRDVAERFQPVFSSQAEFDAMFPLIKPTTDLMAARSQKPVQQMTLF